MAGHSVRSAGGTTHHLEGGRGSRGGGEGGLLGAGEAVSLMTAHQCTVVQCSSPPHPPLSPK